MSKEGDAPGGGGGDAGGKSGDPNPNDNKGGKTYSEDYVNRLLREKKNATERAQTVETKLNEIEADKKAAADKKLIEDGKFKEALEAKAKEAADLQGQLSERDNQIIDSVKLSSFLEQFDGGIKKNYWGLIDLDQVKLDDQGQPTADSVKAYADKFREDFGEVLTKKSGPNLQNGGEQPPGSGVLTRKEWLELPAKDMAKRMKDVEGFPGAS